MTFEERHRALRADIERLAEDTSRLRARAEEDNKKIRALLQVAEEGDRRLRRRKGQSPGQ